MLNFALVGCGRIAVRHAGLLSDEQIKNARLAAVCDIQTDRAKQFGTKYKVPYYTEMNKMMSEEAIDVVTVLTPSGFHAEHVIQLASFKKHIVVEKPLALNLDSADTMIRACRNNGIKLFVVKQNRFNLPVQKLRQALEAGRFGKLVMGTVRVRWCRTPDYYQADAWRGSWEYDGGVLANQASHHVDLLEWMMGNVESIYAKSIHALAPTETEDTAVALLKFTNGALGVIEATTATRPVDLEGSISILGEKGSVEIAGFAVNELRTWKFTGQSAEEEAEMIKHFSVNPPNVYGFGHKAFLQNVVDSIDHDTTGLVDGIEGRKSLELISAIYASLESGQEVFMKSKPQSSKLGKILIPKGRPPVS
jgi:UDP-N-acetyl-2-amino-2-deoxyglucuronate dehydrogenase